MGQAVTLQFTVVLFGLDESSRRAAFDAVSRAGFKQVVADNAGNVCGNNLANFYNSDPDAMVFLRNAACSASAVTINKATSGCANLDPSSCGVRVESSLEVASDPAAAAARTALDAFFSDTSGRGFLEQLKAKGGNLASVHSVRNDGVQGAAAAQSSSDQAASSEAQLSGGAIAGIVICVVLVVIICAINIYICSKYPPQQYLFKQDGGLASKDGNAGETMDVETEHRQGAVSPKRSAGIADRWGSTTDSED